MRHREFSTFVPVSQIIEATGLSASIIFKAAASEAIDLVVPIKRGTAYTLIEHFVDNELVTIDERLVYPVHHPEVSALLLTREACSDLADCNIAISRFFKGGLVFRSGMCVKTLMVTKRTFIPGRAELDVAVQEKKDTRYLPEVISPSSIEMKNDGGAYCSTTSSKRLTELTGVLHFDSYNPINRVPWPLSQIGAMRVSKHIQCYRYEFGVYPEVLPSALVSKGRGIKPPREVDLSSDNLLLPVSDLEKIVECTDNELEIEKLNKFLRSVRTEPVEAVTLTYQQLSLIEDPEFPMSQKIAKSWVDTVCQFGIRGRAPVDAVYRFAAVAVHGWRKIMMDEIESRHFGKHLQAWLEEAGIAKDDATKLAPLVRNEKGHKHRKQLKVSTGDDSPWKKSNLQHFLLALLHCTEREFQDESKNSEGALIPPQEAFISALRKNSSIAETTAEASFRLANNKRLEGALLQESDDA